MPSIICSDENAFYEYKYLMPFIRKNFGQKIFGQGDLKSEDIKGLCLEIIDEWTRKDAAYELVIRANILKIFVRCFTIFFAEYVYYLRFGNAQQLGYILHRKICFVYV